MLADHQSADVKVLPPLPPSLIENHQDIVHQFNNNMDKESDYPISQLAKTLKFHQVFGPLPPAKMLLQYILYASSLSHHSLYIPGPINLGFAQFFIARKQQLQSHGHESPFTGFYINLSLSEDMSRFMVALWHCATISSSHRRGTPKFLAAESNRTG
jgi:hypothetical protein